MVKMTLLGLFAQRTNDAENNILTENTALDFDNRHRIQIVGIVMIFFAALTGIFSVQSFINHNMTSAIALGCLFILNIFAMRRHFLERSHTLSQWVAGLTLFSLFFHCLLNSGAHSISTLWGFAIIAASFYVLGKKWGLIFTLTVLSFLFLLFNNLMNERVETTFLISDINTFELRLISAILLIAALAILQEHDRSRIVRSLIKSREQMRILASTDELTGLANRRTMAEQLCHQERRNHTKENLYSIIICDIDHFKTINDTYGHDAGDKVITEVASVLKNNLRESDTVARWGGEEFLIMLPQTNLQTATQIAEKFQSIFSQMRIKYDAAEIHTTLSFGVASADAQTYADDCIRSADRRMYKAKFTGRNCVIFED